MSPWKEDILSSLDDREFTGSDGEALLNKCPSSAEKLLLKTVLTVRKPCLYLIHFLEKRNHAGHYLGSSYQLIARLTDHANGDGARLTQVLWEDDQDWILAAIYVPRRAVLDVRLLESEAKKRHCSVDYCPFCRETHGVPRGCIQYPTPLNVSSLTLRRT